MPPSDPQRNWLIPWLAEAKSPRRWSNSSAASYRW